MGSTGAIAEALKARTAPGTRGTLLVFEHDERWHTMTVRESPHLELSLPAPDLVRLELEVVMGRETLLATDQRAADPTWSVRSNDERRTRELLDELPWPTEAHVDPAQSDRRWRKRSLLTMLWSTRVIGLFTAIAMSQDDRSPPRYVLTVRDRVATLVRQGREPDDAVAIGMARRLVQLVTRPARLPAEIAPPTPRYDGENGPYR